MMSVGRCLVQGVADGIRVVSVNSDSLPSPGFVFQGSVFGGDILGFSGELYVVGVIEHDEIIQSQCACNAAGALGDFFLDAAVGDVGVDGLGHHFGEAGFQEFGGDGGTYGKGVPLSQRAGSILYAVRDIQFGMSGRRAAPLTELLQVVHCKLAGQCQRGIKHR